MKTKATLLGIVLFTSIAESLSACEPIPIAHAGDYQSNVIQSMCPYGTDSDVYTAGLLQPSWIINPINQPVEIQYEFSGIKTSSLLGGSYSNYDTFLTPFTPNLDNELVYAYQPQYFVGDNTYDLSYYVSFCFYADGSSCDILNPAYNYNYYFSVVSGPVAARPSAPIPQNPVNQLDPHKGGTKPGSGGTPLSGTSNAFVLRS